MLASPICSQLWLLLSSAAAAELYHGLKRIHFISPEEKNCLLYLSHTSLISSHCSCPLNMQRSPRKDYLQHWQQDHLQDLIAALISVDLKEPTQTVQILTTHLWELLPKGKDQHTGTNHFWDAFRSYWQLQSIYGYQKNSQSSPKLLRIVIMHLCYI